MSNLWVNEENKLVHPNAPRGGGGCGGFREARPCGAGIVAFESLPHHHSPAGRNRTPDLLPHHRPHSTSVRHIRVKAGNRDAGPRTALRVSLHGLNRLSILERDELIWQMRRQFEPLVKAAGKRLMLTLGKKDGELVINFDSDTGMQHKRDCTTRILGDDGTGQVDVDRHRGMRVCGPENPITGLQDKRVILGTPQLLARALANAAMHELGHFVANLEHSDDLTNYMTDAGPGKSHSTMRSMRKWLAGPLSFTPAQKEQMILHLEKSEYYDVLKVNE
jgi:hypothetical protein